MSEQTVQHDSDAHAGSHASGQTVHGGGPEHPSDGKYVQIALILGVITAAEVATYYVEEQLGALLVPALIVMMVAKFAIVAAWFMHLKFDSVLFTRVFVTGLVLAVGVYIVVLLTFAYFINDEDQVRVPPPDESGAPAALVVET